MLLDCSAIAPNVLKFQTTIVAIPKKFAILKRNQTTEKIMKLIPPTTKQIASKIAADFEPLPKKVKIGITLLLIGIPIALIQQIASTPTPPVQTSIPSAQISQSTPIPTPIAPTVQPTPLVQSTPSVKKFDTLQPAINFDNETLKSGIREISSGNSDESRIFTDGMIKVLNYGVAFKTYKGICEIDEQGKNPSAAIYPLSKSIRDNGIANGVVIDEKFASDYARALNGSVMQMGCGLKDGRDYRD